MRGHRVSSSEKKAKMLLNELEMYREVLENEQHNNEGMMEHINDIEKRSEHRFNKM